MLPRCTSQGLQSIWRQRCPSSHSHPGRMRLKCADESALLAGKDETFITAASRVRSPSAGRRGRGGVDRDPGPLLTPQAAREGLITVAAGELLMSQCVEKDHVSGATWDC